LRAPALASLHRTGDEICARRFESSGEVRKVVLPHDPFEEMYELRDRIAWLVRVEAHRGRADGLVVLRTAQATDRDSTSICDAK